MPSTKIRKTAHYDPFDTQLQEISQNFVGLNEYGERSNFI